MLGSLMTVHYRIIEGETFHLSFVAPFTNTSVFYLGTVHVHHPWLSNDNQRNT
jgi:hypothetical protein